LYHGVIGVSTGLTWPLFRPRWIGRDNVPKSGGVILAANHRSYVDPLLIANACPRPIRPMAKDEIFGGIVGRVFKYGGVIPVRRGSADKAAIATALRALSDGDVVLIFPEGTRGQGDEITSVFDGLAYLSAKAQVPVIPVGIAGTETVLSKTDKTIKPSKVVVTFGAPVEPPAVAEGSSRHSRQELAAHTELLRVAVQDMYRAALAAR
jgi:1-acyl-sn-glycerol-3-phosphate acyltransferase